MTTPQIKRAYDAPAPDDGTRVLVDRLWPRGLSRERAHIDCWLKDVSPSHELRAWFAHDPARFDEFRQRYEAELAANPAAQAALAHLRTLAQESRLTLVYAARDAAHNNAVVLRDLLARQANGS